MHFVVGSGPSGVAAASALVAAGVPVTLLDAGCECEPERLEAARRMSRQPPEEWAPEDLAVVRETAPADGPFPTKLLYGSAFAYAPGPGSRVSQAGTKCVESHARGGLSNVWGAAVMPARAAELAAWPFGLDQLAPHYAAVGRLMPIAAAADDLIREFPLYAPPIAPLRSSRLAEWLLARMRDRKARLAAGGIVAGESRLAVQTEAGSTACRYTGLCLSGCPYFSIWNAASALADLRARPGFTYEAGVIVERVERVERVEATAGAGVRIYARDGAGSRRLFEGARVLLGCGPIATLRIVARSLGLNRHLALQYQPYFLLPLLCGGNPPRPEDEKLHTLSQIFLELDDRGVSSHGVHLQLYTYNEFIRERVARATAWLGPLRGLAFERLVGRLGAIQGYFDSREAPPIDVRVAQEPDGAVSIALSAPPGGIVRKMVARCIRHLAKHATSIGAVPLIPLVTVGSPGDGNHVGGLFPMRRAPGELETDALGQLPALPGVHIVDSSSLPSLPAATLTYTVMANAHRIASALAGADTSPS
jgi:choline dehydrogenase-like flavoprotein